GRPPRGGLPAIVNEGSAHGKTGIRDGQAFGFRRDRKKSRRSAAHSEARTPPCIAKRWLRPEGNPSPPNEEIAPTFGSEAPKTSVEIRAWIIAPTHIRQGSSVT